MDSIIRRSSAAVGWPECTVWDVGGGFDVGGGCGGRCDDGKAEVVGVRT